MKRLLVLASLAAALAVPASMATGTPLSGHSHWDDPNANYELQVCYEVLGSVSSPGGEIGHIPFREQDSQNFYDLLIEKTGFILAKRVGGGANQPLTPTFKTTHSFGVGSQIMFDLVASGTTFQLYQLGGTPSAPVRGPLWYSWTDGTYSKGVNISYYTVHGWDAQWENVNAIPLDGLGTGHKIAGLTQDARAVNGSGNTFDSPQPASGSVTGITAAKNGSGPNYGLASGANYTYTVTVDKAGTGHFDFRDPSSNADGSGSYFSSSYYRLTLGTTPQIQRYNGSSAGTVWKAPSGSGGAGTYTLHLAGPAITLVSPAGKTLVSVNDGGPQSGVRVRVAPGDQTWSWTGTVG